MKIKKFLKPTIPGAGHRGIQPVSFWPKELTCEILYFASTKTAQNSSSDLSQAEVSKKPRPKGRRIFRWNAAKTIYGIICFFFLLGCSDDEPNFKVEIAGREGNCFDGILNGDEVIVDCGGVCPGFCH